MNNILLSWDCVGSGCRPTQYMIKWSESGMSENQITTNDTSYTIRRLDGCTNYSITVETHVCGGHSLTEDIQTVEGGTYVYIYIYMDMFVWGIVYIIMISSATDGT